jgi:WD40 repeat protein/serine/threonine protein kinase
MDQVNRNNVSSGVQPPSIEISCPGCGTTYRNVKPEQLGKVGLCKKCGHKFTVELKTDKPLPEADRVQEAAILSAQTQAHFGATEIVAAFAAPSKEILPVKAHARTVYAKSPADSAVLRKAEHDVAADWSVGDVILDLYEVTHLLGEGGMGKVYKVRHLGWNLDLAVKCPRKEYLASSGGTEDFVREAETWVNLGQHPNVVSCYYVRSLGEIPRLFAEYIEGGSLSDWIRTGKLYEGDGDEVLARILDIAIQSAWGLHYAHEKGLVHQDMKPGNVMMTPDGAAKITDFGLARARGSAGTTLTAAVGKTMVVAGAGMYTPEYASPEQLRGARLTRRTDIWSWAVSVVEMFAGGLLWSVGIAVEEFLNKNLANWAGLENAGPRPPGVVARILRKCFEMEQEDRPSSLLEIVAVLREEYQQIMGKVYPRLEPTVGIETADILNNRALSLMDLGKSEDALRLWDKALHLEPCHPVATYNRGLIKIRAGGIGPIQLLMEIEEARKMYRGSWMPDYLFGLCLMELGDHQGALRVFRAIRETGILRQEVEDAFSTAIKYEPKSSKLIRDLAGQGGRMYSVSLSHDGRYALSGSSDKTLRLWDVTTGKCVRTFEGHSKTVVSVSLSHDGRYALSGSLDKTLRLWDVTTGKCARIFEGHGKAVVSVSLSHDGRYALSGSLDKTLRLWDVTTGKCIRTFEGHSDNVLSVSLSHDGRYALSGSTDQTLKLWDVSTGKCARTLEGHSKAVVSVSLSHDGRYALSGSSDKTLRLWDVTTGKCARIFEGHRDVVESVSLSHDGRYALSGSSDKTLRLWDVTTGKCVRTFEGHSKTVVSVSLSHDGRYALSGSSDKTLRLWDVTTGKCVRTFEGHSKTVVSVSLSHDGRYALSGSSDQMLRLWDVSTGKCIGTFEGHGDRVHSVSLSKDLTCAVSGYGKGAIIIWHLYWELEDSYPENWDDRARPYLEVFLTQHTPYAGTLPQVRDPTEEEVTLALTRRGKPSWKEDDFKDLLYTLGCAGYGWLRPEGVRRKLEEMADEIGRP